MSTTKSLKDALGPRLYNAAKSMFNDLFDQGRSAVLIGGAASRIYLANRETKDLDVNISQSKFQSLSTAPKISPYLFSPPSPSSPTKMSLTYTTPDTSSSVKCDIASSPTFFSLPSLLTTHTHLDPPSHIRYPTLPLLLALKIHSLPSRRPSQDAKRTKDIEDIRELTTEMYYARCVMSEDLVMFFLVRDGALERFKVLVKREFGEYEAHMEEFLYKRLPQVNPPTAAPPAVAASGAGAGASAGNTQVAGKKVVRLASPSRASASSATTTTTTPAFRTKPQAAAASSSGGGNTTKKAVPKVTGGDAPPRKKKVEASSSSTADKHHHHHHHHHSSGGGGSKGTKDPNDSKKGDGKKARK